MTDCNKGCNGSRGCQGCYEVLVPGCHFVHHKIKDAIKNCPCQECLVKVTCKIPCPEFDIHHSKYAF